MFNSKGNLEINIKEDDKILASIDGKYLKINPEKDPNFFYRYYKISPDGNVTPIDSDQADFYISINETNDMLSATNKTNDFEIYTEKDEFVDILEEPEEPYDEEDVYTYEDRDTDEELYNNLLKNEDQEIDEGELIDESKIATEFEPNESILEVLNNQEQGMEELIEYELDDDSSE